MSLKEQQDLLARLYVDEDFRNGFFDDPERVGNTCGLSPDESWEIAGITKDDLDYFSNTLFQKRLREVRRMLSETSAALGSDFERHFRDFAGHGTPETIRKHLEDAVGFAEYLIKLRISTEAASADRSRLVFYGYRRRFVVNRFGPRPRVFLRVGRREYIW